LVLFLEADKRADKHIAERHTRCQRVSHPTACPTARRQKKGKKKNKRNERKRKKKRWKKKKTRQRWYHS